MRQFLVHTTECSISPRSFTGVRPAKISADTGHHGLFEAKLARAVELFRDTQTESKTPASHFQLGMSTLPTLGIAQVANLCGVTSHMPNANMIAKSQPSAGQNGAFSQPSSWYHLSRVE